MELKIGLSNGGFGAERFVALLLPLVSLGENITGDKKLRYASPKFPFGKLRMSAEC